jgi:RNA polymerase sigma-70 factor, ECF subfamily
VIDENVNKDEGLNFSTCSSLLQRVKANEASAWDRLVTLYAPLVYSWCCKAGLGPADAEDAVQNVFAAVLRNVGGFRRDRPGQSFRAWLRTVTASKIADFRRDQEKGPPAEGGSDALRRLSNASFPGAVGAEDSSDLADHEGREERLLLRRALLQLQPEFNARDWQAFWRVVAEDQAPEEVARELGIARHAVYLAKSRILRRFREEFADLIEEKSEGPP